jgi:hypothetical protein
VLPIKDGRNAHLRREGTESVWCVMGMLECQIVADRWIESLEECGSWRIELWYMADDDRIGAAKLLKK